MTPIKNLKETHKQLPDGSGELTKARRLWMAIKLKETGHRMNSLSFEGTVLKAAVIGTCVCLDVWQQLKFWLGQA